MNPLKKASTAIGQRGKRVSVVLHKHGITLPDWAQISLWICGLIILLVLSIVYSVSVLINYINDDANVAVNTSIVLNELFNPPRFVLSIPFYLFKPNSSLSTITRYLINNSHQCPQCSNLTEMSWDVWNESNFKIEDLDRTRINLASGFIRKMFIEVSNNSNPFPEEYQNWTWPLIESGLYFFSWKYNLDRYLTAPTINGNEKIQLIDFEYSNKTVNGTHIYDHFWTYLLNALCNTIELGVWDYWNNQILKCPDVLTNSSVPTIIDNTSIWIPVPANSSTYENILSSALWPWPIEDPVDYETSVWTPPGNFNNSRQIWLYSEPWAQYQWELNSNDSSPVWPSLSSGKLGTSFTTTNIIFGVAWKMKEKRESKLDKCYTDSSLKLCKQKCSKLWFIQHFGCVPFSFHKILNKISSQYSPYCTQFDYSKYILTYKETSSLEWECTKFCSTPCEDITYNIQISRQDFETDKFGFTIALRPVVNPFVEFSRYTKDKSFNLISNLGGVVSLFLNISFFSFCIFIISCVNIIQYYRRKKTANNEYLEDLTALSLWQIVLRTKLNGNNEMRENGNVIGFEYRSGNIVTTGRSGVLEKMKIMKMEMEIMKAELKYAQDLCGYPARVDRK